jgi:SAM-dependent methyltransferase
MPVSRAADERFDQEGLWGHLAHDPKIQLRARMFEEMIPRGVQTVLDVGCGDGAITNRLAREWDVTGVDLSATALAHLDTTAIEASATQLPVPDNSFDLVMSSEMLEHMPTADYRQAIAEMLRVSRRYLLISVPYREYLKFRTVRCPSCGWTGHVWGHRQTFTAESLLKDLIGFQAVETRTFGPPQERPWPGWLMWTSHNILKSYYYAPGQHPMCERCRNTDFGAARTFHPVFRQFAQRLQARRWPIVPFWLAILAEAQPQQS